MTENLPELCAYGLGPGKHVRGEQADGDIAPGESGGVATPVAYLGFPTGVELAAVALDDEPPVDDEVDTADAIDDHLQLWAVTQRAQDQPHKGLDPRFAAPVQETAKHLEPGREPPEDVVDTALVNESDVPRAVERRDGVPRRLTDDGLRERLGDLDHERLCGGCRRAPVAANRRRARRQARRMGIDLDVRARPCMNEGS